jgi:glycosyltransferase involved in cell wall biosynthesis
MTYLYYTTTTALPVLYKRLPIVMQPTAHNESEIWLTLFDFLFSMPDAFLFLTPEEQDLVRKRFKSEPRGQVVGIGFQQSSTEISTSPLTTHALRPFEYLVYVGRNDSAKGLPLLIDYFLAYKAKNNSELKLLIVGENPKQQDDSDSIIYTGYVTESEKLSLIQSSLALVQPSYFESFSIVLCEAWSQKRPVLVQEKNDVLVGQTQRVRGGLSFSTYVDFAIAVDYLLEHPQEAAQMGIWGHTYINDVYTWESVISKTELVLSEAVASFNRDKNSTT